MRILQVSDRPGWAIDRLSKPIALKYPTEVEMSYLNSKPDRFIASGYSKQEEVVQYSNELGNQFDVVHFHHYGGVNKLVGGLNKNIKKVLTIHTERADDLNQDFSNFDVLIAPTKHSFAILKQKHSNVVFVPYGIDLSRFKYLFGDRPDKNVGFVGRIMKHKRFEIVLKACMDIGFKLIGCGYVDQSEYYYKYIKEAEQKGLVDYIHLLPEGNMQEIYNKMFVYICLSEPNVETGPLPVLEAMACGVPIISTEVGWIKDWGTNGNNYIRIKEEDVNNLDELIMQLWADKLFRNKLVSNGLRLVQDFGVDKYVDNLMEVYNK